MANILSKLKNEKGQSAVELALVAILLLLLVFGITEFGMAWYRADVLKIAANYGARTCAGKTITPPATTAYDTAVAAAKAAIPKYNPALDKIDVPPCDTLLPTSAVTVTVSEKFNSVVPILLPILSKMTITRTATYSMGP